MKALWNIWRWGLPAIKAAIAGGQYAFPRGLFYGGAGPSQSTKVIQEHFEDWIGPAQRIVHIDFHTGLGAFGKFTLLLEAAEGTEIGRWFEQVFGTESVQALSKVNGVAYPAKGVLGIWLEKQLKGRTYRFAAAEFGTYGIIRVMSAIRAENQAHWYCPTDSPQQQKSKAELWECFVPADATWRDTVIQSGLDIIRRSIERV